MSHDRTVSLAVSAADSALVAVSGWPGPDLQASTSHKETIWLSADAGATWHDATNNMLSASGVCLRPHGGVCGRGRPSALLLLPLPSGAHALLVGTVNGVLAALVPRGQPSVNAYTRLGGCTELPLVLVAGLSYEPTSDTLVAATMGRGVYTMHGAAEAIAKVLGA